ncbi:MULTISPECIES: substrate-binding periplasmic protein [Dethiosulfovibrio]|uniref:Transporter substrate-binding domain-containing protein n=2 Tax=Dethiosulfovibrio TaxID=47054 RepID=A0ABS9EMI5_9BACT|nr:MULTISPECIES: transporter substrate-binding domain-containing protein [Dethiosulfovibrio]MCF4114872.1 transporter substrate-binding domain-containing protein [Dethiosulfovibrio russensis]MCF4142393.1 transporter substrate-binding domain-containing protein [Dethiosulfovibrio marinus]MCF4145364.1 transporter substrate-binding domain-containing protein [Dethiosulfovibrio acidaminovorans]MEA3284630.1 transporter substrate-binding domain-containing protein [Synergistota bacterium]
MDYLKKFVLSVLFVCLAAGSVFAVGVDDIRFMTEELPPYNMKGDDGVATGIAVDVLAEMFKRVGSSRTAKDVEVLPWARGYKEVQSTPNTCLFSMTYTDERKPMFKWVGPLAASRTAVVALKSKGIKVGSEADLADLSAGVIKEDIGDILARKAGMTKVQIAANNLQNVKKLNSGRIDVWVYEESVAQWQLKDMGFDPADYETVFALSQSHLYYAFHKDTDQALIDQLQKVLDEMKADGSYQAILDKYLR